MSASIRRHHGPGRVRLSSSINGPKPKIRPRPTANGLRELTISIFALPIVIRMCHGQESTWGVHLTITREAEAWNERHCKYMNIVKGAAWDTMSSKSSICSFFARRIEWLEAPSCLRCEQEPGRGSIGRGFRHSTTNAPIVSSTYWRGGIRVCEHLGDKVGYPKPADVRHTMSAGVEVEVPDDSGYQCVALDLELTQLRGNRARLLRGTQHNTRGFA